MIFIFEDVTNPDAIRRERRWKQFLVGLVGALLVGGFLYWQFRNYPQEREVKRFLQALQGGDYKTAYQIWKPAAVYTFQDFQRDWGPGGDYGKVAEYKIIGSRSRGPTVEVRARINGKEAQFWVDRRERSLSFPGF